MKKFLASAILIIGFIPSYGQHSVARQWNEVLLESIRNDFARPTVHARNLFHISTAMYDAWAAYDDTAQPWFLGQLHGDYFTPWEGVAIPSDIQAAQEEALSYATYRLISHRFAQSPGQVYIQSLADELMNTLGYDTSISGTNYTTNGPAALGNYIAQQVIEFGLQDGSNEGEAYGNEHYEPVNPPLAPSESGNPFIINLNRWQPLFIETFIDQSGNPVPVGILPFLSPEWGRVVPFSLKPKDLTIYERDSAEYWVYHDPGPPPYLEEDGSGLSEEYKWSFSLVSKWSSHLDHTDGVMWDISPASMGNIPELPTTFEEHRTFFNELEGGDASMGRTVNPRTGEAYAPQMVPRGDFTRVLAEFWADGPDSETPPGHWFTILNTVNDHPDLVKKFKGEGEILSDLEWDIKTYFMLGGTMHDVAIAAWGAKGWYDYIRPVSALRGMAEKGQSSDPNLPRYSIEGIPLTDGYIELVMEGDPLVGEDNENLHKIKLKAWKGPDYIENPVSDEAGVDWILADNWWPYQRPTFVTPPFAGYVSGHSTFSRAAAELLTLITGDEYFPGGMGVFPAKKNAFLVFEEGPSQDLELQWATYRDASDQCSLSRIWGGIHPPIDDINGRLMGQKIGVDAFYYAEKYFEGLVTSVKEEQENNNVLVYPNPVTHGEHVYIVNQYVESHMRVLNLTGKVLLDKQLYEKQFELCTKPFKEGLYLILLDFDHQTNVTKLVIR